jgi:hypothetical protein
MLALVYQDTLCKRHTKQPHHCLIICKVWETNKKNCMTTERENTKIVT